MSLQPGFSDLADRYEALSTARDPLERLAAVVNFEALRCRLEKPLKRSDRTHGGRPQLLAATTDITLLLSDY